MKRADSQLLVIFGASGDLTGRKLLPALFELFIGDMLPEHFAILGAARTGYTDEEFRAEQRKHILEARGNKETNSAELDKFLRILFYLAFDSTNSAEYVKLKDRIHSLQQQENIPDRIIYYLATPPLMYELVPKYLQENGMNVADTEDGWRRVIVEKPFGTSISAVFSKRRRFTVSTIIWEKRRCRISWYSVFPTVFSNPFGTGIMWIQSR